MNVFVIVFVPAVVRKRLCDEDGGGLEVESGDRGEDGRLTSTVGKTVFEGMFEGILNSTLTCDVCRHESTVTEPFIDLSLALRVPPAVSVHRRRSSSLESHERGRKKSGLESVELERGRTKRTDEGGPVGSSKRERVAVHEDVDNVVAGSLISSQEHWGGSEVQEEDGDEAVSLFHSLNVNQKVSEPVGAVVSCHEDEFEEEDALLCSLFDDVDDIPTPPSEDSLTTPGDDFDVSPCRNLTGLHSESDEYMSLVDSLDTFLGPEILDGEDRPVCEECTKRANSVEAPKMSVQTTTSTTASSSSEFEKALESSSECSDNTVGAGKSDRSSGVGSEADDIRDDADERREKVTKVRTRSTKRYTIKNLPSVLVLQLNRFQQVSPFGNLRKLHGHCDFPLSLDLSKHVDQKEEARYQLSGVVCHTGSLRGGHYTAFINSAPNLKRWFYCSDTNIQPADEEEILRSEPYLLFYEQCS